MIRPVACIKALFSSDKGETLVESIVSVLIVAVTMLMLVTAIVTATKINAVSQQESATFNQEKSATVNDVSVTFDGEKATGITGKSYEGEADSSGESAYTYTYYTVGD